MDRASQALAQGTPPGVLKSYHALSAPKQRPYQPDSQAPGFPQMQNSMMTFAGNSVSSPGNNLSIQGQAGSPRMGHVPYLTSGMEPQAVRLEESIRQKYPNASQEQVMRMISETLAKSVHQRQELVQSAMNAAAGFNINGIPNGMANGMSSGMGMNGMGGNTRMPGGVESSPQLYAQMLRQQHAQQAAATQSTANGQSQQQSHQRLPQDGAAAPARRMEGEPVDGVKPSIPSIASIYAGDARRPPSKDASIKPEAMTLSTGSLPPIRQHSPKSHLANGNGTGPITLSSITAQLEDLSHLADVAAAGDSPFPQSPPPRLGSHKRGISYTISEDLTRDRGKQILCRIIKRRRDSGEVMLTPFVHNFSQAQFRHMQQQQQNSPFDRRRSRSKLRRGDKVKLLVAGVKEGPYLIENVYGPRQYTLCSLDGRPARNNEVVGETCLIVA